MKRNYFLIAVTLFAVSNCFAEALPDSKLDLSQSLMSIFGNVSYTANGLDLSGATITVISPKGEVNVDGQMRTVYISESNEAGDIICQKLGKHLSQASHTYRSGHELIGDLHSDGTIRDLTFWGMTYFTDIECK